MKDESPQSAYAAAGVDINRSDAVKEKIKKLAARTSRTGVLSDIGLFGGLFEVKGYKEPVLVSSTDGVGTKLKIAALMGRYDTVGVDLVNHCVNDIFTTGAEPLFFLDYIAMGKLVPEQVEAVVSGLAKACKENNCALIGGETAEMPGLYAPGDLDLVGFIVGAVEKKNIIDGKSIAPGDIVLGLPSSGLHTNGYSLARKVFNLDADSSALSAYRSELGKSLGEVLLEPHLCYFSLLKPHLSHIKGLAHITGGGLLDNVPRILPEGVEVHIDRRSWTPPAVFQLIQRQGKVDPIEMFRVFNMGIGMVVICAPDRAGSLKKALPDAKAIGHVAKLSGKERVVLE